MKKALFAYLATASAALAHPGHAEAGHGVGHIDHIIGLAVVAVIASVVLARLRNRE